MLRLRGAAADVDTGVDAGAGARFKPVDQCSCLADRLFDKTPFVTRRERLLAGVDPALRLRARIRIFLRPELIEPRLQRVELRTAALDRCVHVGPWFDCRAGRGVLRRTESALRDRRIADIEFLARQLARAPGKGAKRGRDDDPLLHFVPSLLSFISSIQACAPRVHALTLRTHGARSRLLFSSAIEQSASIANNDADSRPDNRAVTARRSDARVDVERALLAPARHADRER